MHRPRTSSFVCIGNKAWKDGEADKYQRPWTKSRNLGRGIRPHEVSMLERMDKKWIVLRVKNKVVAGDTITNSSAMQDMKMNEAVRCGWGLGNGLALSKDARLLLSEETANPELSFFKITKKSGVYLNVKFLNCLALA